MRGEAVPEAVRADALRDRRLDDPPLHDGPYRAAREPAPAGVHEDRVGARPARRAHGEVGPQRRFCGGAEGHQPLFLPLAQDTDKPCLEVDFGEIEADELGTADAGGIEQLQDRAGPYVRIAIPDHGHQSGHVCLVEMRGNTPFQARGDQGPRGIGLQDPLPAQVPEERPQAGELSGGGALLEAVMVEAGQERTEEQNVHVPRARLAAQLPAQMDDELTQIVDISANRVGRGVALPLQVATERGEGLLQEPDVCRAGRGRRPGSSRSEIRKRSSDSSARAERASRLRALSRTWWGSSGNRPNAMLVGW